MSKDKLFSGVQLGPHQEVLRELLLKEDPGPPARYGCVIFGLQHEGKAFTNVLIPPSKTHIQGHKGFKFVFGGFLWVMLVSGHDTISLISECTLQADGTIMIMIRQASEMKNIVRFSRQLASLGRSA